MLMPGSRVALYSAPWIMPITAGAMIFARSLSPSAIV